MRIGFGTALSEVDRSAVTPPPLCRACRFCRPAWGAMVIPFFWPFPYFWRLLWRDAECRHPTSFFRPSQDFVTGRRERPLRMSCNGARGSTFGEKCGPEARYWQARDYPAWLWTAVPVAIGLILSAAYVLALRRI